MLDTQYGHPFQNSKGKAQKHKHSPISKSNLLVAVSSRGELRWGEGASWRDIGGYYYFARERRNRMRETNDRNTRLVSETQYNMTYSDSALIHQNRNSAGENLIG